MKNKFFINAVIITLLGIGVYSLNQYQSNSFYNDINATTDEFVIDFSNEELVNNSFTILTRNNNQINCVKEGNVIKNETAITGIETIEFESSNEWILVKTGFASNDYLYERSIHNDGTNRFSVSLCGEAYFSISSDNEILDVNNVNVSYSCSKDFTEVYEPNLSYSISKNKTYFVVKGNNLNVTNINVPSFYVDGNNERLPVKTIGETAFDSYTKLEYVSIPSSVTKLDNSSFINCKKLKSIFVPDSVTTFGYNVFYSDTTLEHVRLSNNLKTIGDSCFFNCDGLTEVHLPNSLTSTGTNLFNQCSNLVSVNCPRGLSTLNSGFFYHCDKIENFTITSNVKTIANQAFRSCANLSNVSYEGTIEEWNKISKDSLWASGCPLLTTIHCSDGDVFLS